MPHPKNFFIRPAEGLRIADPQTGDYLPENGLIMPRSAFWLRRLKDGDVIEVKEAAPGPTNNPEPAPAAGQETGKMGRSKKE